MPAANVSIEAVFEASAPSTVNVVFNAGTDATIDNAASKTYTINSGSALNTHTDLSGAEAAIPTPVREGYTFMGWHDDSDTENANSVAAIDLTAAVSADASYTAVFVKSYETFADGKIQAISITGATDQSAKTYAKLKYDKVGRYEDGVLLSSIASVSGGKFASGNAVAIFAIDTTGIDTSANKVEFAFKAVSQVANTDAQVRLALIDAPESLADLTFDTLKTINVKKQYTAESWTGRPGSTNPKAYDITADVPIEGDATIYYVMFMNKDVEHKIQDVALNIKPYYTVTAPGTIENGSITADKATAVEGDTVTVTVSPADKYEVTDLKVNSGDVALTPDAKDSTKYTFTMPAGAATITGSFVEKQGEPAGLKLVFTTDGADTGKVGETTLFTTSDGTYVEGDEYTISDDYKAIYKGEATSGLFRAYKYVSGLDDAVNKVTLAAGENTKYIKVTDQGKDFYEFEDFEVGKLENGSGPYHNFTFGQDNTGKSATYENYAAAGRVLWMRPSSATWKYTNGIDNNVEIEYEEAFVSTAQGGKTITHRVINSDDETLLEYNWYQPASGTPYMSSIKFANGTEEVDDGNGGTKTQQLFTEEITDAATSQIGSALGVGGAYKYTTANNIGHVKITINKTTREVKLEIFKGTETTATVSYSQTLPEGTNMKLGSWYITGHNKDGSVATINDFTVAQYVPQ